jgi:hypothetical protein
VKVLRSIIATAIAATAVGVVPDALVAQQLYQCTTTTTTTVRETTVDGAIITTTLVIISKVCIPI